MSVPQKEAVKSEEDIDCEPKPLYETFSANASQSEIYDCYVEELKKQETNGKKEEHNKETTAAKGK